MASLFLILSIWIQYVWYFHA